MFSFLPRALLIHGFDFAFFAECRIGRKKVVFLALIHGSLEPLQPYFYIYMEIVVE